MSETTTQSIPFRSPSPVATSAPAETATRSDAPAYRASEKSDDVPPGLSQELDKKPFAIKFLELDLYHDDPAFPEVKEQAKVLDDYVIKQMKAQGLKDEPSSYKEVIDAIYKQIGKSTNEDPTKALKRLSVAAGAIDRLNSAKLQPILSAKNLSPTEFEEIQA